MENTTEEPGLKSDSKITVDKKRSRNKKVASDSHVIRKRAAFQIAKRKKDIYIGNKTDFKAYLRLCEKLLDSDAKEVVIHGLGGAINKACSLALHLQEIHSGTLGLDIKTSSVNLTDDLEPKDDEHDYEVNERLNSAVHIRIFHTALIGSLRIKDN